VRGERSETALFHVEGGITHQLGWRLDMRIFGLILTLVLAGSIAAAAKGNDGRGSSDPRSGGLHVTKECSQYTGLADSFCTITSSNLQAITAGSRVVYLQAAGASSLDSDVVLVVGPGNYALGHVTLDLATGTGEITLSGGTGQFKSFRAKADVSHVGGVNWAWDGKYRFRPHG
jgi:hypothetical protein